MTYQDFLASKFNHQPSVGIIDAHLHSTLYPFQQALTSWALKKGRCALFADCGLGKTPMQLEWAKHIPGRTLILAPLAVAQQTVSQAHLVDTEVKYVREQSYVSGDGIYITNYEMMERFDESAFNGVVLDESSILKAYDGKTRTRLIEKWRNTPYRLCCTATPAPNDVAEIANHAEFLGIMTRAEMLAMFFVHDDDGWRLKGHAVDAFYEWMASWGMFVKTPSDLGFSDEGYILPELHVEPVIVDIDTREAAMAQGRLFFHGLQGIQGRSKVRKLSMNERIEAAVEIVNNSTEQWLVWCGLNDEGREMGRLAHESMVIEGKDKLDVKIRALSNFADGSLKCLVTKPSIAGFGMNFQNCHNQLFLGMNDSYEMYYQAIRRSWRFGQKHSVNIKVVISNVEAPILENVQAKEKQAEEMSQGIIAHIKRFEMAELGQDAINKDVYSEDKAEGNGYTVYKGDCVEQLKNLPDASVDFSVFSPPFQSLFTYSASDRDMGNSLNQAQFFEHYQFFLAELHRVFKPGRIVACHVAQVAATLAHDGFIGIQDFRGKIIQSFTEAGFHYYGDVTVDKNPQAQAIRTHAKGLLFAQLKKDASWLRPGLADYILIFRKPGENEVPIHPDISNEDWIEWAHPVWYDIRESDTLNAVVARENNDERHICPLQLGLIERCIRLWSSPGETVLSPFMGIGSEGYESILLGRKFVGIELKDSYYRTAIKNLEAAHAKVNQQRLL
jgi:DNA modification methylase